MDAAGLTRKSFVGAGLVTGAALAAAGAALGAAARHDTADSVRLAKLRAAREKLVVRHTRTENEQEFDETIDTFEHARYEVIPLGAVHDGDNAVAAYFEDSYKTFPDQRSYKYAIRHADCAVIAEFAYTGTMKGELAGIPPTGKSFKIRVTAFFLFEPNSTKLTCERVYFDVYSLLQQIGVLKEAAERGITLPVGGGISIDRKEPGVKAIEV